MEHGGTIEGHRTMAAGSGTLITGRGSSRLGVSQVLSDASAGLTNIGNHVSLTTRADAHHAAWTDTVLTVAGSGGTDTVTLLNSGSITLANLAKDSMVL